MGLQDTVKLLENLDDFFIDGFILDKEMKQKYELSPRVVLPAVGIDINRFSVNSSIYDVSGNCISIGDINVDSVKKLQGVYYILSGNKINPKQKKFIENKTNYKESPHFNPHHEDFGLNPKYVKASAIARIIDGEIQTSKKLIQKNYN